MKTIKVHSRYIYHLAPEAPGQEAQLIFVDVTSATGKDWVVSGDFAPVLYECLKSKDVDGTLSKYHQLAKSKLSLSAYAKNFSEFIAGLKDENIIEGGSFGGGSGRSQKKKKAGTAKKQPTQTGRLSTLNLKDLSVLEVQGTYYGPVGCGDHNAYGLGDGGDCFMIPSDERLKENIESLEDSLDKILQLNGVRYNWRDKERFWAQPNMGLIAQEVEKVFPELIFNHPETGTKMVAYTHLMGPMVEAVKTLTAQVSAQAQQIEELKTLIRTSGGSSH